MMRAMRAFLLLIVLALNCLQASATQKSPFPFEPWLTGPFLAPAASNQEPGQPSFFNCITGLCQYGVYDSDWSYRSEPTIRSWTLIGQYTQGITEKIGIEIIGTYTMRSSQGVSSKRFNDTILSVGYQLSEDDPYSWVPDFMVWVQAIVPTGDFSDPRDTIRRAFAFTGQGALFLGPNLAYQKQLVINENVLVVLLGFGYNIPFRTSIRGFSVYGGGIGTNGTIRPGHLINANISLEYALNQRWALATDIFATYQTASSRFKGAQGVSLDGSPARVGAPTSTQITLTPSIEYSCNSKLGWLLGSWVTVAGQNSSAFAGGFLCLSIIF